MKVLFVASGNAKNGLSPIIQAQAESLIKLGIDIDYFLIKGKGLWNYFSHIKPLRSFLREKDFDIIHAHYGLCGIISYLSNIDTKLIVSFMGSDILGGSFLPKINKIFAGKYDCSVSKSHSINKQIKTKHKVVIPNGVDLNVFKPLAKELCQDELKLDPNKKYVLFAANPDRNEKNYLLALESFDFIKTDAELLVVFNESQRRLNLYYNAVDCLLLTSKYEGSPNVVKEAMACNCPIVSTDVGDVTTIIGDTKGCYVTSFDPDDIADKICKAVIIETQTKGRERLIGLGLDSETVAKRIIVVYSQTMSRN